MFLKKNNRIFKASMTVLSDDFQGQFSGFSNTPHLFKFKTNGLRPYLDIPKRIILFNAKINPRVRLGLRVERFVSEELKQNPEIKILIENYQVRENKHTLGELDSLFLNKELPIHLEIQFKYYLIDPSMGGSEINQCIGPMRRDSLNDKLTKLKNKQLPLLFANETKPLLDRFNLSANDFEQYIYFKAQLFIPYGKTINLKLLNPDCIYGFYFNYSELPKFKECKFYKPKKTDWLLDLSPNVNWQTYDKVLPQLKVYEDEKYSPLLWLKFPNGELTKCFVVSW